MSAAATAPTLATVNSSRESRRRTGWSLVFQSLLHNRFAILGILVLVTMATAALFAPVVAPYDTEWQERGDRLVPPSRFSDETRRLYLRSQDPMGKDIS